MANFRLLSAALFAAAVAAAPAMAREHHVRHVTADTDAVAAPSVAFAGPAYGTGYRCVPAPRVGAFAGEPWANSGDVPCEPGSGAAY